MTEFARSPFLMVLENTSPVDSVLSLVMLNLCGACKSLSLGYSVERAERESEREREREKRGGNL